MVQDGTLWLVVDVNGEAVLGSLSFRFGIVGAQITQAFAERVAQLGVSHKQVGVLAVVDSGRARSQREIADALGVAPSLVVTLIDRLVEMGAVRRVRDNVDRRIQTLEITPSGHALLGRCVEQVRALDDQIRTLVGEDAHASLTRGLELFVGDDGLPTRIDKELPSGRC